MPWSVALGTRRLAPFAIAVCVTAAGCPRSAGEVPLANRSGPALAAALDFSGRLPAAADRARGRADLDGDGADDCWDADYAGGSGQGGWQLAVRAPCSGPALAVDSTGSFGEFLTVTPLPPALGARPRLIEGVVELLYGRAHLRTLASGPDGIDGSFRWLLDHYRGGDGPAGEPFAEVRSYRPRWTPGPPALPASQVAVLSSLADRAITAALRPAVDPADTGASNALVAYFAHNHHELDAVARCGQIAVAATDHAIIVYDEGRDLSSWVFVTTGTTELRHASIGRVACAADLVVFERAIDGVVDLFVADPSRGRYGRLPLAAEWLLDDSGLTIDVDTYGLSELGATLAR